MGYAVPLVAALVVAAAVFLAVDPLERSPIAAAKNFTAHEVPLPSLQLLSTIPRDNSNALKAAEIKYGSQIFGPESVIFDFQGRGPYTGAGDGRVMRWEGDEKGWVEFAAVIPNRTGICNQPLPLRANIQNEHLCGRPLGLRFHKDTGDLYIMDAYFGLLKVGPEGGIAEVITDEAEGQKIVFGNDLDIDHDGTIYFTDSSSIYPRKTFLFPILEGEDTGRLLKWDPQTKETTVVARNLRFANGVTFSKDHSFLVVSETGSGKLNRYWVKGPKAGTIEDFAWLAGYPDNVRTNDKGEFWVALHCRRNMFDRFFKSRPNLRRAFLKLPISLTTVYTLFSNKPHAAVYKYNEEGEVVQVLEDQKGEVVKLVSEVEEHDGKLYFGSVILPHIAVYKIPA